MIGANKLEHHITLGCKGMLRTNNGLLGPFLHYEENGVLWIWPLGLYHITYYSRNL
jgi:hypothetical protein